jgi:predicted chitinase
LRGLSQISQAWNYWYFGKKLGMDLLKYPEDALKMPVAAYILVEFIRTCKKGYGFDAAAKYLATGEEQNLKNARIGINGGLNDYAEYKNAFDYLARRSVK